MALLHMDGFDLNNLSTHYSISGGAIFGAALGRFGGGGVDCGTLSGTKGLTKEVVGGSSTLFAALAFKTTNIGSVVINFKMMTSDASQAALVSSQADGSLRLYNCNNALVATSATGIVRNNTWHYLEFKVTSDNAGTVIVKVDGVLIFSYVGSIDTSVSVTTMGRFFFGNTANAYYLYFDDLVVWDDTGSAPRNDFMGDMKINTLLPNADTATSDWTRSSGSIDYQMIDDVVPGAHDSDGTYLYAGVVGEKSIFGLGNLPDTPIYVYGIKHSLVLDKATSDTREARGLIVSNGNTQNGTTRTLTTSYTYYEDIIAQDPDGPQEWDKDSIDALQVGVEVVT